MAALWNKIWGHSAGVKRSAPIDEQSDGEETDDEAIITLSSNSRQPLAEGVPEQMQNRRLRPLECVLIPEPSHTDRALLKTWQISSSKENKMGRSDLHTSNRTSRKVSDTSNRNHRIDEFFGNGDLSTANQLKRGSRHISLSAPVVEERPTKRLRRTASRPSYFSQMNVGDIDVSQDELLVSEKKIRGRKPSKKDSVSPEASDYEAVETDEDQDDEFDDSGSNASADSIATVSDDEFSDDVQPTKRPKAPPIKPDVPERNKTTSWAFGGKKSTRMGNLLSRGKGPKGLDSRLPPLSEIDDIFADITKRALGFGLGKALKHFNSRPLRVATMCSGTESPILALRMIQNALKSLSLDQLHIDHLFSAEIVPYKQAYIERNFSPPIIFRDITELTDAVKMEDPHATSAYGARVPVPINIDFLIAGTSCVDFSKLNTYQKGLFDGGESDKTWHAVLNYCTAFRPKIVLLENVKTAHWDQMLGHYEAIGYEVAGVHVDTKDFYIPQTRQRGYMVCFDRSRLSVAGLKDGSASSKWQNLMGSFRRYASSPVSSFLLTNDQVVSREQSRADETKRDYDWSRCEITQMQYRQTQKLGNARPFTHWQESGAMLVPDSGSKSWYSMQVERVLDTIDAALLRKALPKNGGYDARFKTRIWNLSQNIYRDEDKQSFGMIGCITPSGQYFVSDVGRALTPEETLKLQGLPLDMISFTTETPPELQDLAGNAMSSSVIGSAILSALIAGFLAVEGGREDHENQLEVAKPEGQMIPGPMSTAKHLIAGHDIVSSTLLEDAKRTMRRCYCEQSTGLTKKPIQICRDCGHTTCTSCGGNPAHSYRQRADLSINRISPAKFEADLRSKLPLRVKLTPSQDIDEFTCPKGNPKKELQAYLGLVKDIANTEFFISHFRRTHCLTITYQAPTGRLELVIVDDAAEWRLFVKPPKHLGTDDWLRKALIEPVAKCIARPTLFDGVWEFRIPDVSQFKIQIVGHGKQMPSWWSRNEMPEFIDHTQWELLTINANDADVRGTQQDIEGTYQYLPKCGTACDSLYRRIDGGDDAGPLYLFLDPRRTESPEGDQFVFSRNKELLEYDEVRLVLASLDAAWKPWDQKPWKLSEGKKPGKISHETDKNEPTLFRNCRWIQTSDVALQPLASEVDIAVAQDLSSFATCSESPSCKVSTVLISCTLGKGIYEEQPRATVDLGDSKFFLQNAWVFEAMRRQLSDSWHEFPRHTANQACLSCAPTKPSIKWKMCHDGDIMPFEDPSSAAAYERAVKQRPNPIVITRDGAQIHFGVNLITLAHRAFGNLPVVESKPRFDWRLNANDAAHAPFSFQPFKLKSSEGIAPYSLDVLTVKMFPKQRLALAWMRQQEAGAGQTITLEASEEISLPKLRWTLEMRARASLNVRGGICADHPGFGKTITSLALIESQFREMEIAKIRDHLQTRSDQTGRGLLGSAATLIVCPQVLLDQWIAEIQDKLAYTTGCIVIRHVHDLGKHSMQAFQDAKIILVNRTMLGSDAYAERVAAFTGIPGPVTNKSRVFGEWLRYATAQIPKHLSILQESGQSRLRQHVKKVYEDRIKSEEFKVAVPSRRLRGKDYTAADQPKKLKLKDSTGKAAVGTLDPSTVGSPLFEMFYFNRLIIDEFHQFTPREYAAIVALKADKRWGLSATPALGDFYDVAQMAGLLGVSLPIGSDARGIMKIKNVRELRKEMTDFERFDSMRTVPSNALHSRIHAQHQKFLDTFVRRNIMDFEGMEYDDHLEPVHLDLDHQALYTELSQHLNSMDMRIKKGTRSKNTDRQGRLTKIFDDSLSAEEALSKTAVFDLEGTGCSSQQDGLANLVSVRTAEVKMILKTLSDAVASARRKETDALESWIDSRLKGKTIGDLETIEALEKITLDDIKAMKGNTASKKAKAKKTAEGSSDSDEVASNAKEGKNALTSVVNTLAQRLLVANRSVRFTRNIQLVQCSANDRATLLPKCDRPRCDSKCELSEIGVSALCGHMICVGCFRYMESNHTTKCPASGCSASMHNYHILWSAKMGNLRDSGHTKYGAKIDNVANLLQNIQHQGDQAIVFVQFPRQLDQVKNALKGAGISAIVVDEPTKASSKIEEFRKSAQERPTHRKTALVLNASDETAAGSNLQNANHIIFLSPLLRDTQYGYESTMAQAIGRVRRHGQKKHIHVYRVVALDTIDVDILEHREHRRDAICEQNMDTVCCPVVESQVMDIDGNIPVERTQLVRENGRFSLRPKSWLVSSEQAPDDGPQKVLGKNRVIGWEDFSSLVKFSRAYTEDDE